MEAYTRAIQRQSQCRQCAAKIDPRQMVESVPDQTTPPLASFWKLLDAQASGSKAA